MSFSRLVDSYNPFLLDSCVITPFWGNFRPVFKMPFHITKNFGDVKGHFKNRLGVTQKSCNFHHTFLLRAFLHCKSLKNSRLIQTTRGSNFTKARIKQIG